eukprot:SAG31_NODE_1439_length_8332_cov_11.389166_4_plen_93_part_00
MAAVDCKADETLGPGTEGSRAAPGVDSASSDKNAPVPAELEVAVVKVLAGTGLSDYAELLRATGWETIRALKLATWRDLVRGLPSLCSYLTV